MVPINAYVFYDLITLFLIFLVEMKFTESSELNAKSNKFCKIMNPNVLPDLGSVEYCLIDKTGTLTANTFDVRSIELAGNLYYLNDKIADINRKIR